MTTRFRYQIAAFDARQPTQALVNAMNKLGLEGWEIFQVQEVAVEKKPSMLLFCRQVILNVLMN